MFRLHLLLLLTVIFIGIRYGGVAFGLLDVLTITIPATVIGVTVAATWSLKRGKDLDKNPEFQERLRDPQVAKEASGEQASAIGTADESTGKEGSITFSPGILSVVVLALFSKQLLPDNVGMAVAIQFMILSVGAVIILLTNINPKDVATSAVFTAGMTAVITIFGIAPGNVWIFQEQLDDMLKPCNITAQNEVSKKIALTRR